MIDRLLNISLFAIVMYILNSVIAWNKGTDVMLEIVWIAVLTYGTLMYIKGDKK